MRRGQYTGDWLRTVAFAVLAVTDMALAAIFLATGDRRYIPLMLTAAAVTLTLAIADSYGDGC